MKKVFLVLCLFVSLSANATIQPDFHRLQEVIKMKTAKLGIGLDKSSPYKSTPKSYPQHPTYLNNQLVCEPKAGAGGLIPILISKEIPGYGAGSFYVDTIDLKTVEEVSNSSVSFYLGLLPDTLNPVTSVILDTSQVLIWLKDREPEDILFWAIPRSDSLKPSHPAVYTFDTTGSTPAKLRIYGPKKVNITDHCYEGSEGDISGRYLIRAEDLSGKVVPSYGDIIDPSRVKVDVIDTDGSAMLYDFILQDSGQTVDAGLITGQANIYISNSQVEKVKLVARSTSEDLLADTFEIDFRPLDEAVSIFLWSHSGTYGTQNANKSVMALAIPRTEGNPDVNNSSSKVQITLKDIMGSLSTQVSPTSQITLAGGVASFVLHDTEQDSAVIVQIQTSGTPELPPAWWSGAKTAFGFKGQGKAIKMILSAPTTVLVGDTADIFVYAVDANNGADTTYTGWVRGYAEGDDNWSCLLLDEMGSSSNFFYIYRGISKIRIVNSEAEQLTIEFKDAETNGIGNYIGSSEFDAEVHISFQKPGTIATRWLVDFPKSANYFFPVGEPITATIKAVDSLCLIDTSFNSSAYFQIGLTTPLNVPIHKGKGTVTFQNDSIGEFVMKVTGSPLSAWEDTVYFAARDSALWLIATGEECIVNDSVKGAFYAMTPDFNIDYNWSGKAYFKFQDPGNSSFIYPDLITISNGYGSVNIFNSEVESVFMNIDSIKGTTPLIPKDIPHFILFKARLTAELPQYGSIRGAPDIIRFKTIDGLGNTIPYTTWVYPWCYGGDEDNSITWTPKDSLQIVDGVGYIEIENTEAETVKIEVCTGANKLLQPIKEPFTLIFKQISDTMKPTSCIASSPAISTKLSFPVSWTAGNDAGSGLSGFYRVKAKDAGAGSWTTWLDSTKATSANYIGYNTHKYYFEAGAYDNSCNLELFSGIPECSTYIDTLASDTASPQAPQGLVAIGGDQEVLLYWEFNPEQDVIGYNIYRKEFSGWLRINLFAIRGKWYLDKNLPNDSMLFYTITAVDNSNNESQRSDSVSAYTSNLPPRPVQAFTGVPIEGARVKLSWIPSPSYDVAEYNIYWDAGSGTINYSLPLITLFHPESTWVSAVLTPLTEYKFGIRAEDDCGNEEDNTKLVVSITPKDSIEKYIKTQIFTPFAGKHIWGKNVTIAARILYGSRDAIKCVKFQYKPVAQPGWENIIPAIPRFTNPDSVPPYFTFWDVTALTPGLYNLRSIAFDTAGNPELNPSWSTIAIFENFPDEEEGRDSSKISEHWKKEKVYSNTNNWVYCGTGNENSISITMIPAYGLYNDTRLVYYIRTPENYNTDPYKSANEVREIWLENGQTILLEQKTFQLTIPYMDGNNDGFVDNADSVSEVDLWMSCYNENTSQWDSIQFVLDTLNHKLIGWSGHTGLFALLGPNKTGIENNPAFGGTKPILSVYPNPFTQKIVIRYSLNPALAGRLAIYDLSGRLVKTLFDSQLSTLNSQLSVVWDRKDNKGKEVSNGIYFCRLVSGNYTETKKIIAIK